MWQGGIERGLGSSQTSKWRRVEGAGLSDEDTDPVQRGAGRGSLHLLADHEQAGLPRRRSRIPWSSPRMELLAPIGGQRGGFTARVALPHFRTTASLGLKP